MGSVIKHVRGQFPHLFHMFCVKIKRENVYKVLSSVPTVRVKHISVDTQSKSPLERT